MNDFSALGKSVNKFEKLDRVPTACQYVEYHSDQLTSSCPITSQPDFYEATIQIETDGNVIETKSLKLYLETYRDQAIFCEDLAVKICQELFDACKPKQCTVILQQRRRGGIQITAKHTVTKTE